MLYKDKLSKIKNRTAKQNSALSNVIHKLSQKSAAFRKALNKENLAHKDILKVIEDENKAREEQARLAEAKVMGKKVSALQKVKGNIENASPDLGGASTQTTKREIEDLKLKKRAR